MKKNVLIAAISLCCIHVESTAQIITTIAGNGAGAYSGNGGPATMAALYIPNYAVADAAGNVYIAEYGNHVVRKVDLTGTINLYAGNGTNSYSGDGGPATAAALSGPEGLALDASGNLYINDDGNSRIRKVTPAGVITTVAGSGTYGSSGDGGPATAAEIGAPDGICLDSYGNLYITDAPSQNIRMVNAAGIISTIAGTGTLGYSGDGGPATAALLNHPTDVFADNAGNLIFSDEFNNVVRKISSGGVISTIAGTGASGYSGDGGPATAATFNKTAGVWEDCQGNVYICDFFNNRVRVINTAGIISTFAGTGAGGFTADGIPATASELDLPCKISMDFSGNFLIGDRNNERVRKITMLNHAPDFEAGASGTLTLCKNAAAKNIDTLLGIVDTDYCQAETWTVTRVAGHGSLAGFSATAVSGGGVLLPSGLTYQPTTGYTGHDTFDVKISDGIATNNFVVYVAINSCVTTMTGNPVAIAGDLSIIPNPNNGSFQFELVSNINEPANIIIYDMLGKKVKEIPSFTNSPENTTLSVPPGLYIIEATTAHGKWVQKLQMD